MLLLLLYVNTGAQVFYIFYHLIHALKHKLPAPAILRGKSYCSGSAPSCFAAAFAICARLLFAILSAFVAMSVNGRL